MHSLSEVLNYEVFFANEISNVSFAGIRLVQARPMLHHACVTRVIWVVCVDRFIAVRAARNAHADEVDARCTARGEDVVDRGAPAHGRGSVMRLRGVVLRASSVHTEEFVFSCVYGRAVFVVLMNLSMFYL